jgi:uncharacterized membrane protein YhiD involved in acid resistance
MYALYNPVARNCAATAATALGLCCGGGQLALGLALLLIGLFVLEGLKWTEKRRSKN